MNRKQQPIPTNLSEYQSKTVLITGSLGSLGRSLSDALKHAAGYVCGYDNDYPGSPNDVLDLERLRKFQSADIIFHLAAHKHAPYGEAFPYDASHLNVQGTQNVLEAFPDAIHVLASTCKAIEPETAYGASKLIAERMVLNHPNGRVARFYNVVETQGNVFELWESLEPHEPIPVTDCQRFFISKDEAVSLLLYAGLPSTPRGCYSFLTKRHAMRDVAKRLYPGRDIQRIQPRRGDRLMEPFIATGEGAVISDRIVKVKGPHAGA